MNSTVVFFKQLGDFVLLQPALSRLLEDPEARVNIIGNPAFAPVLELAGHGGRAFIGKNGNKEKQDLLLAYERGSKAAWAAWKCAASRKQTVLSKETEKRWFHALVYDDVVIDSASHEYRAHYYWHHTPGNRPFTAPALKQPPIDWVGRHDGLKEYVLIHATSAWRRKCWPTEQWKQAIQSMAAAGLGPFAMTSGPVEWEMDHARSLMEGAPNGSCCLAGRTDLKELISLIARARLVIAVDGAVAHLAAALGRPSIALFGPANPLHWHSPTGANRVLNARDYTDEPRPSAAFIPVADLVKTAEELWSATS